MSQKARIRKQHGNNKRYKQRRGPSRDFERADLEVRIGAESLDGFVGEETKDPDTLGFFLACCNTCSSRGRFSPCADHGGVAV